MHFFFIIALFLLTLHEAKSHPDNESLLPDGKINDNVGEKHRRTNEITTSTSTSIQINILHKITSGEISVAAAKAKHDIDIMFNQTEPKLVKEFKPTPFLFSTLAWNDLMAEDEYAKEMSYSGLISILTTQKLRDLSTSAITNWSEISISGSVLESICPVNVISECVPGKYRTYSGHCNNVAQPFWGAIHEPMQRLKKVAYSDGSIIYFLLKDLNFRCERASQRYQWKSVRKPKKNIPGSI